MFLLIPLSSVWAYFDPQSVPNNKFGIHILEEKDIESAARLVNSKDGQWGYVTIVIRDDQRNLTQWNNFFTKLRLNRLIPIVRIATHLEGSYWRKPSVEDAWGWTEFLDNLLWPTDNRYVVLFNEPNHANEWGGTVSPREYAQIVREFSGQLKEKSRDFFILNAGFDMAATNDALWYWQEMNNEIPGIFAYFDGWVSHSYPNPHFSQSPLQTGRTTISGYRFEQEYLQNNFNIDKKPLFITETGWKHNGSLSSENLISQYFQTAFSQIWTDDNIIAVTPFLLNYPDNLFSSFSWLDKDGKERSYYTTVQQISKNSGKPHLAPVSYFGKLKEKLAVNNKKTTALTFIPKLIF